MRSIALIFLLSLWSVQTTVMTAEPDARAQLDDWLAGRSNSTPTIDSPATRKLHLDTIRAALRTPEREKQWVWRLTTAQGLHAAALWPDLRKAIIALPREQPKQERSYTIGEIVQRLGPTAGDLLDVALPDPAKLGLTWPNVVALADDPGRLVPFLRQALTGADEQAAKEAAQALGDIAWSPAATQAIPELIAALERWREAPVPPYPSNTDFWRDSPDPDTADDMSRKRYPGGIDPWPEALTALAAIDPTSKPAATAAFAYLADGVPAYRRRAALAACAVLSMPQSPTELARAIAPWLGPGERGGLALAALARTGDAMLPTLAALPRDRVLAVVAHLLDDWQSRSLSLPLPTAWIPLLSEPEASRREQLLVWCGGEGVVTALRRGGGFAQGVWISFYEAPIPVPEHAPVGLIEALSDSDQERQELAQAALQCWNSAPWVEPLMPRLLEVVRSGRNARAGELLVLRALGGDAQALAWVRGLFAKSGRKTGDGVLHQHLLSAWRNGFPADLQALIPAEVDANAKPDDPMLLERLTADPLLIFDLDEHQAEQLVRAERIPAACWPAILAWARDSSPGEIPFLLLLRDPRYRSEGLARLRAYANLQGGGLLHSLWYSSLRHCLPAEITARWLTHGDPSLRLMARELTAP